MINTASSEKKKTAPVPSIERLIAALAGSYRRYLSWLTPFAFLSPNHSLRKRKSKNQDSSIVAYPKIPKSFRNGAKSAANIGMIIKNRIKKNNQNLLSDLILNNPFVKNPSPKVGESRINSWIDVRRQSNFTNQWNIYGFKWHVHSEQKW